MSFFNRMLARALPFAPRSIVARVANRYIAGETLEEAIAVAEALNRKGLRTTMDLLGEDAEEGDDARRRANDYAGVLEAIADHGLDANVSVKPTQFGLKIAPDLCLDLFQGLAERARGHGGFVRVEMEHSACTDATLEVFAALRKDFENVGIVIQAYLHRSQSDLERVLQLGRLNVRLVKGVYVEPPSIAYQDRNAIRRNWVRLAETLLESGAYVGFATHDDWLVERALTLVDRFGLSPGDYEFQVLLGVREELRDRLLRDGRRVRVYVPFGEDWHPYSMRRMRENPQIAGYVLKALLTGR